MKTFLAQNAFISNSAQSDTCVDTAVAPNLQPLPPDATAVLHSVSPGGVAAPHNSGEREPVSNAGLPLGGSLSSGDLRALSLRAGESEPLPAHSPGGCSSDDGSSQSQGAKSVLQAGYAGAASSSSGASAAIISCQGALAAVDLQALWDCITDDRIVLISRGDDPDRPMFLETFRLGEAAAQ